MPAGYSDQYWAEFALRYSEIAAENPTPNREVSAKLDIPYASVGTKVLRARQHGFLTKAGDPRGVQLTEKAKRVLEGMQLRRDSPIAFEAPIYAQTKEQALAEVWDVVLQLENWNPKDGPFKFEPARLRNLGRKEHHEP